MGREWPARHMQTTRVLMLVWSSKLLDVYLYEGHQDDAGTGRTTDMFREAELELSYRTAGGTENIQRMARPTCGLCAVCMGWGGFLLLIGDEKKSKTSRWEWSSLLSVQHLRSACTQGAYH